ncbi:MAG: hypothetical protein JWO19_930 [Bryobacterales bacterium]|nr:hypothetical protein [Bryobacterales bacterium]
MSNASRLLNHVRFVKQPFSAQAYPTGPLREFREPDRVVGIRHKGTNVIFRFAADADMVRLYFAEDSTFEQKTDPIG